MALTATAIRSFRASPPVKRREEHDGRGLYLVRFPSGQLSWALRYRRKDGSKAKLTLGTARLLEPGVPEPEGNPVVGGSLTLKQARRLAENESAKSDPAKDRAEAKRLEKDALGETFEAIAAKFIERYSMRQNRPSWLKETARLLGFKFEPDPENLDGPPKMVRRDKQEGTFAGVVAHWARRPVREITKVDVNRLLEAIVDRGTGATANNVLAVLRRLFNWLKEQGVVAISPCDGVKAPAPKSVRDRTLEDHELVSVWRAAEAMGQPFGPFVQLLLLTGQRRDEVAKMRYTEIDRIGALWFLAGERVKNNRAHEVPLSGQALAVLAAIKRIAGEPDYVFTSGARAVRGGKAGATALAPISGFSKAKAMVDAKMLEIARQDAIDDGQDPDAVKPIADWRFHDLRRTCTTGLARLGQPPHVIEAVLNHKSGVISGVAAIYNRYSYADEKKAALVAWGAFVERAVAVHSHRNVVELARA